MTVITKQDGKRQLPFDEDRLIAFIEEITKDYPDLPGLADYQKRVIRAISTKNEYKAEQITNVLIMSALDKIGTDTEAGESPDWTFVAAAVYLKDLYKKASRNRVYDAAQKYGSLYSLIQRLTEEGIYATKILETYSKEEINALEKIIQPERDRLYTYLGIRTLSERYLATDHDKKVYELPQERHLIIAMALMSQEPKEKRLFYIAELYWALSSHYMTVATPTLANAGKSYGQLSSCFIDTVDDSLRGIYDSNTDVATLSKNGGGIGIYMGKVRALGSSIKGFKGISSGTVPWIKQLNNTGVSVDQLGLRKGSIAVYQDAWHKDIIRHLEGRLNNGDPRNKFHDIFTGICIPDLFMEKVERREDWYLFDPHEVRQMMGYSLEDFYDEEEGSGSFREKYQECVDHPLLTSKTRIPAIELMKAVMKSQLETGTPFMFYRDEVNRKNPNPHAGMIYCSNLCSEIAQNQSSTVVEEEITKDGKIIITKTPGDFVVCNLSSINLGKAVGNKSLDEILPRLIEIQVRALDNVIDLNDLPVPQAKLTNQKYRAVGLGTSGLHQTLALRGISWESEEAVQFNDELYEKIAFLAIRASMNLAKEKGAYPVFKGSDWETGAYFTKRGYDQDGGWMLLAQDVKKYGIRNAYLQAVAPTGSTASLSNSTPSVDPIFKRGYSEEKKDMMVPVTIPDLNPSTFWFYKSAYQIDQVWSIRQNAKRQRHVDQAISFNLYVSNDIKASELLNHHLTAWKEKLKTTYYVRSTAVESLVDDCEVCGS